MIGLWDDVRTWIKDRTEPFSIPDLGFVQANTSLGLQPYPLDAP